MAYNLDILRNKRGVIPPSAMKMNGESEAQIRRRERAEGESGETQFFYGKKPIETEAEFVLGDPNNVTVNKNFDTKEVDPKKLRKKKRELIRKQRDLKRSGEITKLNNT